MDNGKRDRVLRSYRTAGLVATYEELLSIPNADRITHYFGDYGSHFFNYGTARHYLREAEDSWNTRQKENLSSAPSF